MTQSPKLDVALITGEHPYDVVGLHQAVQGPDIALFPQSLDNWAMDVAGRARSYDALLFYNFHQQTAGHEPEWWEQGIAEAIEGLADGGPGVFLLHHAILAYPEWSTWTELSGLPDRRFVHNLDQEVRVDIADGAHPAVSGVEPFTIIDETYTMDEPGPDNHIILTTENDTSMSALAWSRRFGKTPVFCFQPGHDNVVFETAGFRDVVSQGLSWVAQEAAAVPASR